MAQKIYLLDTNVLLHDPTSLFHFEGALVGIPTMVLEELDAFKKEGTDKGRNAREVIRQLDALRERGSLRDGVPLDNGGVIKVLFSNKNAQKEFPFSVSLKDNELIMLAFELKDEGYNVVLISKDLNVRVKADALGINASDYLAEHVTKDEFYHGWRSVPVPVIDLKRDKPKMLEELLHDGNLETNEFIILESRHNPHNYRLFRFLGDSTFLAVQEPHFNWPLKPRNVQQLMALNLLTDPSVRLVVLSGPAGTGKTLLSLFVGLHKVLVEDEFEKMLVARPVVPLGRDIGFLPGTLQEKLYTWMLPVYDNIEFILHEAAMSDYFKAMNQPGTDHHHDDGGHQSRKHKHGRRGRDHDREREREFKKQKQQKGRLLPLDTLVHQGKVSLEAITYMRGRSIPYQFIFIDEVQNLTPHEVKTLVSRIGEGSKLVLAGDPYQIDTPYLDFSSNGLVVTGERLKGQKLFGMAYLSKSERSELSQLANDLL